MTKITINGKVVEYDSERTYMHAPDGMNAQVLDMPKFLESLQNLPKEDVVKTLEGEINACGTWSRAAAGFMWNFASAYGQSVPSAFSDSRNNESQKIVNTLKVLEDIYQRLESKGDKNG